MTGQARPVTGGSDQLRLWTAQQQVGVGVILRNEMLGPFKLGKLSELVANTEKKSKNFISKSRLTASVKGGKV